MKSLDTWLLRTQIALAIGLIFIAHVIDDPFMPIYVNYFLAASLLMNSYRLTSRYKIKNATGNLIHREEGQLIVNHKKEVPFSNRSRSESIAIARISEMTITQDMLSIILDGNGQGYDFYLQGTKEEIFSRLNVLLNDSEKQKINIRVL